MTNIVVLVKLLFLVLLAHGAAATVAASGIVDTTATAAVPDVWRWWLVNFQHDILWFWQSFGTWRPG